MSFFGPTPRRSSMAPDDSVFDRRPISPLALFMFLSQCSAASSFFYPNILFPVVFRVSPPAPCPLSPRSARPHTCPDPRDKSWRARARGTSPSTSMAGPVRPPPPSSPFGIGVGTVVSPTGWKFLCSKRHAFDHTLLMHVHDTGGCEQVFRCQCIPTCFTDPRLQGLVSSIVGNT